ncbi:hypothetical protein WISP_21731 [Willisornis vidua]|uniref:Uncharacterized protein n=1 Tax=Willisornis vidua TaxID=1566151 RepID=A0ABQ9DNP7_9PASS|nr:hypothetical protein WISP_21731 [Willisornis vidua]
MEEKLNPTQQCALEAQKANHILSCIKSRMTSRLEERVLSLCSQESPPRVLPPALGPQRKKDVDLLEHSEEDTEMLRGLQNLFYKDRLREMGLFSLEKKRLQGDLPAALWYLKGPLRKLERDFLRGHVVTEQGATT